MTTTTSTTTTTRRFKRHLHFPIEWDKKMIDPTMEKIWSWTVAGATLKLVLLNFDSLNKRSNEGVSGYCTENIILRLNRSMMPETNWIGVQSRAWLQRTLHVLYEKVTPKFKKLFIHLKKQTYWRPGEVTWMIKLLTVYSRKAACTIRFLQIYRIRSWNIVRGN